MEKRQAHIILTFMFYLFITSLHRLMNNMEPYNVDLFLFYDMEQDIQWYVKDTLDKVGEIAILFQFHKSVLKKTKLFTGIFIFYKFAELIMYYVNYLQLDWAFNFLFISVGITYYIYEKSVNNR